MREIHDLEDVLGSNDLWLSADAVSKLQEWIGNRVVYDEIVDGVVHQVARLRGSRCSVILKHRGDRCRRIPTAPVNPEEIRFEADALRLLGSLTPGLWPTLLWFDENAHTLVLSDLAAPGLQDGRTFFSSASSKQMAETSTTIVETLAAVHVRARSLPVGTAIRPDGDRAFFSRNMFERITYHDCDSARSLADSLSQLPRHIIIGDFGPKNMLVGNDLFRFFDLEHVHSGPAIFDLSFLLGHIVLHRIGLQSPAAIGELIEGLIANYDSIYRLESEVKALIAPVVAAIIAYRLRNPFVPYSLPLDEGFCNRLAEKALDSLKHKDISTGEQVARILTETGDAAV